MIKSILISHHTASRAGLAFASLNSNVLLESFVLFSALAFNQMDEVLPNATVCPSIESLVPMRAQSIS